MVKTYTEAIALCREKHVPVLIHVEEVTQPQGHSTSGSHERYKGKDRLEWEQEFDCIRKMREFIRALEAVSFKPPNASGSGYSAAQFAKEGLLKILDSFGIGTPARAALQYTGIGDALSSAQAKQAVRAVVRPNRPNLNPALEAIGRAGYQSQDGGR